MNGHATQWIAGIAISLIIGAVALLIDRVSELADRMAVNDRMTTDRVGAIEAVQGRHDEQIIHLMERVNRHHGDGAR